MTSNDLKMTSNENDKPVSKNIKTKINLGRGDPKDNQTQGRDLIEQTFSST